MRYALLGSMLAILPFVNAGCPPGDDDDASPTPEVTPTPVSPTPSAYGIPAREPNTTCIIEGSPAAPSTMALEQVFTPLTFDAPIFITHSGDGTDRLFVVEQGGQIKVFANSDSVSTASTFLDLRSKIYFGGNEMGLLGLAFHPDYASNGYFYVNYTADDPMRTVIARYQVSATDPNRADAASELVLLEFNQPYTNHNGGMLAFGPDGYLYIATGDGGSGGDPQGNGQNTTVLLGKILRIDVDHPASGLNYGIPADNPFASSSDGSRGEIFAWGMRNPWRFSFDRVTGRLWAGDVGQDKYEEIDLIENGKNYGWNTMEGQHCYNASTCDQTGLTLPITEYPHSEGVSVTGGYVYRGSRLPELYGQYLYADFSYGWIRAIAYDGATAQSPVQLLDSTEYLSSFGEDEAGEVYVLSHSSGGVYRLVPAEGGGSSGTFPTRLSDTGCFSDVAAREPAPGVIGYAVNSPLYADYALKDRFFAVPDTLQIGFTDPGAWDFPDGSITIKDFYVDEVIGNPATKRLLETRLMIKNGDSWNGYTYKWNEEQTDAYLLEGSLTQTYTLIDQDGQQIDYTHYYPSRYDCQSCHTQAAGFALGLRTGEMNRDYVYATATDNQLRSYDHIGLFSTEVPAPYEDYGMYPDPADESSGLEARARSYLQANCAHCHQPGSTAVSTLDFRFETPFADMNACDVPPAQGDLGVEDAMLIAPGEPSRSILSLRMHSLEEAERMPPLGTSVVDPVGTAVIDAWISELSGCP